MVDHFEIFAKSEYPKDIRPIIQELNRKRIEMGEKESQPSLSAEEEEFILPNQNQQMSTGNIQKESQWSQFLQTVRLHQDTNCSKEKKRIWMRKRIHDTLLILPFSNLFIKESIQKRREGKQLHTNRQPILLSPFCRIPSSLLFIRLKSWWRT